MNGESYRLAQSRARKAGRNPPQNIAAGDIYAAAWPAFTPPLKMVASSSRLHGAGTGRFIGQVARKHSESLVKAEASTSSKRGGECFRLPTSIRLGHTHGVARGIACQ